jgi:hypothetical protein
MYRWGEIARREPLWASTGRPAKLNPEVVGRFLTAIRAGNYRETAARLAGIGPSTMYRWLHDPRPEYAAFRMALDICEAEVEAEIIGNLARLSRTSTRAAAFLLERRWPERWAKRKRPPPDAPADTPTAPPPPQNIEARTFSISELVASFRAQATAPRRGDTEL